MSLNYDSNLKKRLKVPNWIKPLAAVALSLTMLITFFGISFAGNSTLGNFVWYDTNGNGIKDEPAGNGINGVVINLYHDVDGNGVIDVTDPVSSTITMNQPANENGDDTATGEPGFYVFNNIDGDGTQYIVEIDPDNFLPGGPLEGHEYTGDQAFNDYNGDETRVVLLPGLINDYQNADFSYVTHNLGNYVWIDLDNSGSFDAGEDPVEGVVMELLDGTGTPLGITTTTNISGFYIFGGLNATDYQVNVAASNFDPGGPLELYNHSTGADQEADPNGDVDQVDNGLDGSVPETDGITSDSISLSDNEPTGETTTVSGVPGDPGIPLSGTNPASSQTYDNSHLAPEVDTNSNLTLDFAVIPPVPGITITKLAGDAPDGGIYYINESGDVTYTFIITNTGETYLTNITIVDDHATPSDPADDVTLTSTECPALAGPLAMGDSITCQAVMAVILSPEINTAVTTGTPTDSGGDPIPDVDDPTADDDAEVEILGSIGDTLWGDLDTSGGDQTTQGTEPGLEGVVVTLTYPDGVTEITTTTNISGFYIFEDLPLGTYTVTVDPATIPDSYNMIPTYDPDGGLDNTSTVTIDAAAPNNPDQDFSYPLLVPGIEIIKLAGDAPDGMIYNINEAGIVMYTYLITNTGATYLSDIMIDDDLGTPADTSDDVTFTSTDCADLAGPLAMGASISCVMPITVTDSPITNTAVTTGNPTDENGVDLPGVDDPTDTDDAVVEMLGSIGDTIWGDLDDSGGDQTTQGTEPGLEGVVVTLTYPDGVTTMTTTTDSTGNYLFEELPLGDYTITIDPDTIPPSYNIDATYDPDSPAGSEDNMSAVTIDTAVPNNMDQDFSYPLLVPGIEIIKLAGDAPDGEIYNINNPGIVMYTYLITNTGATYLSDITIDDDLGTPADMSDDVTFTSADCADLAGPLAMGLSISCVMPITVTTSPITNTASTTGTPTDENGDPLPEVDPPVDEDDATVEILGSIGDTIWGDLDDSGGDQTTQGTEPGLEGVVVTLTYPDGTTTMTTTTDSTGNYLFEDLPLGDYTVTVDTSTLPDSYGPDATYDPDGPVGSEDSTSAVTIDATEPNNMDQDFSYPLLVPGMELIKLAGDAPDGAIYNINNPGIVMYTYLITNTGATYLSDIMIDDDLGTPADTSDDVTFTSADCADLAGPLAMGASISCVMPITVTDSPITNTAVTTGNPTDENGVDLPGVDDPTDTDDAVVEMLGSIGDTIWADSDTSGGDQTTQGTEPGLEGVVVTLTYPDGVTTMTTTTDSTGSYIFEDLPLGDYTVTIDPDTIPDSYNTTPTYDPDGGSDNTANVTLDPTTPNNPDQDFSYPPLVPGIMIVKTAGTAPDGITYVINGAGDVTYTYVITNTGATYLSDITITDDNGTVGDTSDDVTLTSAECADLAGPLAMGDSVTCTALLPVSLDPETNIADTTGNPTDENGVDLPALSDPEDEDDAVVDIVNPMLQLTKTLMTPDPVRTGDPITFALQITNTGDVTITMLPLTDTYDTAYLTYVDAVPVSDDNVDDGAIDWTDLSPTFGPLAPGASVVVVVNFTAKADTTGLNDAPCTTPDQTCNEAGITGAVADVDGPGPMNPVPVIPDDDDYDEDDVQIINPTSVNLMEREVRMTGDGALISWGTASEVDMVGFYLLRRTDGGEEVRINDEMIEAKMAGQADGTKYSLTDGDADEDAEHTYTLEIVLNDGRTEQHMMGDTIDDTLRNDPGNPVSGNLFQLFIPVIFR